jgi:hypothetical protein
MLSFFIRRKLRATAKRYGYDVSYLDYMLTEAPRAFFKFAPLAAASSHREVVPIEASFAAKITGAMAPETALGFGFADAIVHRSDDQDFRREAVRARWGDKGVIDLAMALQTGRLFPMMKLALGYAKECRRVSVDGHEIDVVKQAA